MHTRPGQWLVDELRHRVFTENGGSLYYEAVPNPAERGLVEGGTPECRSAAQLVLYQRAQDRLLTEAAREAELTLARRGVRGELSLVKNCRDAVGNIYGAQESYEATLASGWALLAWRAAVLATIPLGLLTAAVHWALLALILTVAVPVFVGELVMGLAAMLAQSATPEQWEARASARWRGPWELANRVATAVGMAALELPLLVLAVALAALAFRPYRRAGAAFLISRCVLSGAGTLLDDGRLALSEKALAIRRMTRRSIRPSDRGLLEVGHLIKPFHRLIVLDWRGVASLLRPVQRFQLGLSDANLCDEAELLKVGTTSLVLDLVEGGHLTDAPVPRDPIAALHVLAADRTLTARVPLRGGGEASALELQRFYQRRAAEVLRDSAAVSLEAHDLVARWGEVLDQLERDPDALFGRLDWVTKARLLDDSADLGADAQKKVDVRYHELGTGYHAQLAHEGMIVRLWTDEEVSHAIRSPPEDTPANERGRLVRLLSQSGTDARVGWEDVRVGGIGGKVIPLRRPRSEQ